LIYRFPTAVLFNRASAEPQGSLTGWQTDRNCLGRNSQPHFYAVVVILLFHMFITESRMDTWMIALDYMSNANIYEKFRCSKKVEKHCPKTYWWTPQGFTDHSL